MSNDLGQPPKNGWSTLAIELLVNDYEASLRFWRDLLGFEVSYRRPEQGFAYMDLNGAQIMICQRNGKWETGQMEAPLGRGVMFQVATHDLEGVQRRLAEAKWPIHTGPVDAWRQVGDREAGQREVFVQDPDGYLIMMNESLGERPLPE